jgi:hypothetical protein
MLAAILFATADPIQLLNLKLIILPLGSGPPVYNRRSLERDGYWRCFFLAAYVRLMVTIGQFR